MPGVKQSKVVAKRFISSDITHFPNCLSFPIIAQLRTSIHKATSVLLLNSLPLYYIYGREENITGRGREMEVHDESLVPARIIILVNDSCFELLTL